ncbi:MAG TPA: DUF5602 domain-containing protein [Gemmatimonadaceae bacterium]
MRQTTAVHPRRRALALTLLAAAALGGCQMASGADAPTSRTTYGAPVTVGRGTLRAYVTEHDGAPTELGVAFSETALEGLPTTGVGHHGGGGPIHQYVLDFPSPNTAPFRFVEVNWNPLGHEPAGVYQDVPHFDFHFYTVSRAERDAIVPADPEYAAKANALPTGDYVPPFALQLGPPGATPAEVAVPMMGVHWVDARSAELQRLLGKPEAYRPFTRTFLLGSWNGRFHFWEPMITRAHMLAKKGAADAAVRDEVIPIAVPARFQAPGHYPTAYRITWDSQAREYRVALTGLTHRE